MPAAPKTTHYIPKDKRTPNPTKPIFAKRKPNSTLKPISDKRLASSGGKMPSTTFATADPRTRMHKARIRWTVKPWRLPPSRTHEWGDKAKKRLRQMSAKQRVKLKALAELKVQMLRIWDQGCIFNFLGNCAGQIEMAHGHTQQAHPETALNIGEVLPCCLGHHRMNKHNAHNHGPYIHALAEATGLVMAAQEGRRPQPSWTELQAEMRRVIRKEERSEKQ